MQLHADCAGSSATPPALQSRHWAVAAFNSHHRVPAPLRSAYALSAHPSDEHPCHSSRHTHSIARPCMRHEHLLPSHLDHSTGDLHVWWWCRSLSSSIRYHTEPLCTRMVFPGSRYATFGIREPSLILGLQGLSSLTWPLMVCAFAGSCNRPEGVSLPPLRSLYDAERA